MAKNVFVVTGEKNHGIVRIIRFQESHDWKVIRRSKKTISNSVGTSEQSSSDVFRRANEVNSLLSDFKLIS